jgi:purine-cytosine permease-like protein
MLMVLHGPIATNILNVYSSALAAVSAGIRATRIQLGIVAGIVGYAVTLYFVANADFASKFDSWMVGLILWMSPWAAVVLSDFYIVRRQQIDVPQLYASPETSVYGDVNWIGISAFIIGLVAGWMFEFGLVAPLQGLISKHFLEGADLSWLVGMLVAGGIYVAGMRNRATTGAPERVQVVPG